MLCLVGCLRVHDAVPQPVYILTLRFTLHFNMYILKKNSIHEHNITTQAKMKKNHCVLCVKTTDEMKQQNKEMMVVYILIEYIY